MSPQSLIVLCLAALLAACKPAAETTPPAAPAEPAPPVAETQQASPWDQAKARGSVFRGIGQEPGWFVEVGPGATPALNATLDNGEREVQVAAAQALADNAGFSGKTADGVAVELQIKSEACSDVMSGEAFAASAKLTVGDKTYSGCGRFLAE